MILSVSLPATALTLNFPFPIGVNAVKYYYMSVCVCKCVIPNVKKVDAKPLVRMPPIACKIIVDGTSLQNMSCYVSFSTVIALNTGTTFVQQLASTLNADNFARWQAARRSPLLLFVLSWCLHILLTVLWIFKQLLSDTCHI